MTHRIVFGVLYLSIAVWAFVLAVRQKREEKDYRVLQVLGLVSLIYAVVRIWLK